MEFIKKVFDYFLHNPLYAVLIAVCYVAITVVVILLCAKRSKSKPTQTPQPDVQKESVETIQTVQNVDSNEKTELEKSELEQSEPEKSESKTSEPEQTEPEKSKPEQVKTETSKAEMPETVKVVDEPKPTDEKINESVKAVPKTKKKATTETTQNKVSEPKAKKQTTTAKVATVTDKKTTNGQAVPPAKKTRYNGKWVLWRLITKNSDDNQADEESFFFELLASNGEKLLSSEEYSSLAGAQKGIQTHKTNILKNNFRISLTKKGDYIFKLLNGKNSLLCTGENYSTKVRCEKAIESTKRFAETAIVDENVRDLVIQLPADEVDDNIVEPDNNYTGKWVISSMISPDGNPVYYFELFASNGEKLLSSEEYVTYSGAINGINTHKNNIERNNFRISLTKRGDYIFKLLNANEQLLCLGEHYKTRNRCERAVESVKRFAKTAPVMDSPSVRKPIVIQ